MRSDGPLPTVSTGRPGGPGGGGGAAAAAAPPQPPLAGAFASVAVDFGETAMAMESRGTRRNRARLARDSSAAKASPVALTEATSARMRRALISVAPGGDGGGGGKGGNGGGTGFGEGGGDGGGG